MFCTFGLTCARLLGEEYGGFSADCKWRRVTTASSTTTSNSTATPTEMAAAIVTFCPDICFGTASTIGCVGCEEGIGVQVATVEEVLRFGEDDITDIVDVADIIDVAVLGELPPETELPV